MANINVTLKRYNQEQEYDIILPTTHLGQIYTDDTLLTPLSTYLTNTFLNVNLKGANSGLAELGADGKVPYVQLPAAITGGLKFVSALSANTDLDTLGASFSTATDGNGSYWIATADIVLTSTANSNVLAPGDEGDYDLSDGITLEAGDWIVLSNWASGNYTFAIINNTYQNASIANTGIVKLSDATTVTGMSGNDVITEGVLAGLIGTATGDIAAGDHLHDNRYYTETEIGTFFNSIDVANGALTGYNKGQWDTAYGWGDHSLEGYLTEESLADLTDVSYTSLATHNILRYNGTNWVNDGTFKPTLYNTSFTNGDGKATITGTICIEHS